MYRVELSPDAQDAYAKADRPLAKKIARCLAQLEQDPRASNNSKALVGPRAGQWRYQMGGWRAIYKIHDDRLEVMVIEIGPRGSVY